MNINGIQIEEHGSGYAITLRANIGREEVKEGMTDEVTSNVLAGFTSALVAIERLQGGAQIALVQKEPLAPSSPQPAPVEAVSSAGAARRRGHSGANPAPVVEPPTNSAPSSDQRRRRRSADAETTETASGAAPAQPARRRGRTTETPAQPAAPTSRSDFSDEDLTKAASQTAAVVGAPAVKAIIEEFGVTMVNQIKPEVRAEFIGRLQAERDAAERG